MIINGKEKNFKQQITVSKMLSKLNLQEDKVVVEVNYAIIPKESYKERILNQEDKIEIVSFVGGG